MIEIPNDLSCAYLKGHLLGRAQDWYQIFGSSLVQNTATDFAQIKMALSKAFPAIRNKKDLVIRFYSSQQRRDPEPTDFTYDLLKLHIITTQTRDVRGSFSEPYFCKPGLTHVLYHEIDTGDKPPVVSWPYRYCRVKQTILDYHVEKILKEGTVIPIQSPYASPVVICRKNNGLPSYNAEAYTFAAD
ncbi:uncharacterized protein TNCV_3814941 [Trichonephila clavipes]|nr:uncharacterized protein TNCV_3814941 [Trichonephila clavipes]